VSCNTDSCTKLMHSFVTRYEEDSTVGFKGVTLYDCKFSRGDEKLS
jgi:hypothetical protein